MQSKTRQIRLAIERELAPYNLEMIEFVSPAHKRVFWRITKPLRDECLVIDYEPRTKNVYLNNSYMGKKPRVLFKTLKKLWMSNWIASKVVDRI